MYQFFLNEDLLPIPPREFTNRVNSNNTTEELLTVGEINIQKSIGLRLFTFSLILPSNKYPWIATIDDFKPPIYYLVKLRDYKKSKEPIRFIVTRLMQNGTPIFDTNILVSVENYNVVERGGENGDVHVNLNLKEFKNPTVKETTIQSISGSNIADEPPTPVSMGRSFTTEPISVPIPQVKTTYITQEIIRPVKKKAKEYRIMEGDTLWRIAKTQLNDGSRYRDIAILNGIQDVNNIQVGQVLRLL